MSFSTDKFGDEPFNVIIPLLPDPVIVADPDEPLDPLEPDDPDEPDEPDEPDSPDCANINPHWSAPPNGIASEVVKGVTPRV